MFLQVPLGKAYIYEYGIKDDAMERNYHSKALRDIKP